MNGSGIAIADGNIVADIEPVFRTQYEKLTRAIAGIVRDPGRAEELAVEVLLKWSRNPRAAGDNPDAWLYRTAVRAGLDELRRRARRSRYESFFGIRPSPPTPEDELAGKQEQERVRFVLGRMGRRAAELLLLRSHGQSYDELAAAVGVSPGSIGTLLSRAEKEFRKEYVKRYGER